MTTDSIEHESTPNNAELAAARAISAFLHAREIDPDASPKGFVPEVPAAADDFWRTVEALGLFVGPVTRTQALETDHVNEGGGSFGADELSEHTDAARMDDAEAPVNDPALADVSIEGYRILGSIHRGGQGAVYKALQLSTKRVVAVKVLLGGVFASARHRLRFEREIDLVASLNHPNIVRIYDSGLARGQPYFAMEYIRGKPLDSFVRDRHLRVAEVLDLFKKVCAAVSFAHQRGVIHRDLKPGNILVDEQGEPHVLDFGLAKIAGPAWPESGAPLSVTREFIGTLAYASPEQASGDPSTIDIRTDVYSLGVILYELLTGQFPYPVVGKIADILKAISEMPPLPPSSWHHRTKSSRFLRRSHARVINNEIEMIVLKALAKEKTRRYQSAGELQRDIENYLGGNAIEAKRDSAWYVLRKLAGRHRYSASVLGALALAIMGFGAISYQFWQQTESALREVEAKNALLLHQTEKIGYLQTDVQEQVRQMVFGWFLFEWHEGHLDRARAIRDSMHPTNGERKAAEFLLDENVANEQLVADVPRESLPLAYFVIGERFVRAGRHEDAAKAFQESIARGADSWLAAAARSRLGQKADEPDQPVGSR